MGPVLSVPRLLVDVNRLYATLPGEVFVTVKRHEVSGTTDSEEYQQAVNEYSQRYMNRVQPKPEAAQRAEQGIGIQVVRTMWGAVRVTGHRQSQGI